MLRIRLGEGRKRYSMPDPDVLHDAYGRVRRAAFGNVFDGEGEIDAADLRRVLMLAQGYLDLTTYVLGQECCVGKLRDVWRARRARQRENRP